MTSKLRLPSKRTTRPLAAALLALVAFWGGWVAWTRLKESGASFESGVVQDFLESRFAALSGGVYHVQLGRIHFDIEGQGARIDSVVISTDTVLNRARRHPLPLLHLVLLDAQITGVVRDADGEGVSIREIRFGRADATMTFAPPDTFPAVSTPLTADSGAAFISWTLQLPLGSPQVRVGRVILDRVQAELRPAPGTGGRIHRIERLHLVLDSVRLDRRVEGITAPIVVHDIRLQLANYHGGWDSATSVSLGELSGSFRDSSLRARSLALTPNRTIAEVVRRGRTRRDRFTVRLDSVEAYGVDWGAALRDGSVPARVVALHRLDLQIFTDRRLPGRVTPRPRALILQQALQRFGRPIALDSLRIHDGRIRYRIKPDSGEGMGSMDIRHIEARLTGLVWRPGPERSGDAELMIRGTLWGGTPLRLVLRGPPGARVPRLDAELWAGGMPMIAANSLATAVGRIDIRRGTLDSLRVQIRLEGDHCDGEARPYYQELSVRLTARGGFFSRLAGGARSVIANSFVVRDENPGPDGVLMVGPIDRTRDPGQSFWPFFWICTRDGLAKVAAGRGVELRP
jgi:hypothetical protein